MVLRINYSYHELFPTNCAIIEQNGDGEEVGTCCYYSPNGYCPRHGLWKELVADFNPNAKSKSYKKLPNACEYDNCTTPRHCFHYCEKHHMDICIKGLYK